MFSLSFFLSKYEILKRNKWKYSSHFIQYSGFLVPSENFNNGGHIIIIITVIITTIIMIMIMIIFIELTQMVLKLSQQTVSEDKSQRYVTVQFCFQRVVMFIAGMRGIPWAAILKMCPIKRYPQRKSLIASSGNFTTYSQ